MPILTTDRLFAVWGVTKRSLGEEGNRAGRRALQLCPQIAFFESGTAPRRSDARAVTLDKVVYLRRRMWGEAP